MRGTLQAIQGLLDCEASPGAARALKKLTSIKVALKDRGIDTMLDEARDNNKENDAENLKKKCSFSNRKPMEVSLLTVVQDRPSPYSFQSKDTSLRSSCVHQIGFDTADEASCA